MHIQHLTGKLFTHDACCDDSGKNAHCDAYSSPANSFLHSNVVKQHVCLNAPFAKLEPFFKHYLKCKAASPFTTSACVVVPSWQGKWCQLLSGMKLLRQYSKGANIFSAPVGGSTRSQLGPSPWAVDVWYDAPAAPKQINAMPDSQPLLTTFAGRVAGQLARVLIHNGATDNYVSAAFVASHKLKVFKCEGYVLAAGTEQIAIRGYV